MFFLLYFLGGAIYFQYFDFRSSVIRRIPIKVSIPDRKPTNPFTQKVQATENTTDAILRGYGRILFRYLIWTFTVDVLPSDIFSFDYSPEL